ncbi:CREB binding protein [Echinococcus multilocularis]|uniref:histone acetyltransferase n=1 Tax=Echinococcus multilocularis TaxID=6211 RepID=A0A068YIH0_ECHMU|nr:CREB binding protein [Echinococcus multilocularis]
MANLEVIPEVFVTTENSDGVEQTRMLQEQLRLLLHAEWCLTVRKSPRTCTDPQCPKIRDVYRHIENCTGGVNCKLPQCAPVLQLTSHFCSCEDQQCPVCEPMKYALEKRFYPIEREGGHLDLEFTLTREQRSEVIRGITVRILRTAGAPDLSDIHFPGLDHAIQCVKYFEDEIYTKATAMDQYDSPIAHYVISHIRGLEKYSSL